MTEPRNGVLFAGLPGSGKTTAATYLSEKYGGTVLPAGEMIRDEYNSRHGEVESSEALGEFAAQLRDERGPSFYGDMVARKVRLNEETIEYPLWLDSFRHEKGVRAARDFLSNSQLFWIDASRDARLERLRQRGRDDESDFTIMELIQRDSHELEELGVLTLMESDEIDSVVPNDGSLGHFRQILDEKLWPVFKDETRQETDQMV